MSEVDEKAERRAQWTREVALEHSMKLRVSGHAQDESVDAIINDAEAFREFLAGEAEFECVAADGGPDEPVDGAEACPCGEDECDGIPMSGAALLALLLSGVTVGKE